MQITKKEDSVLVELSQAELSAIRFMAETALDCGSALSLIDPADNPCPHRAWINLQSCSTFLNRISEHAERIYEPHEFDEVWREFYELFMPEALGNPSPL